jgi:hypothetical protein
MIIDILKDHRFNKAFSLLLGVGIIIIILKPVCKDKECIREKAPTVLEMKDKVYNLGDKCYIFDYENIKCPQNMPIIEPFMEDDNTVLLKTESVNKIAYKSNVNNHSESFKTQFARR